MTYYFGIHYFRTRVRGKKKHDRPAETHINNFNEKDNGLQINEFNITMDDWAGWRGIIIIIITIIQIFTEGGLSHLKLLFMRVL